ncbi:hypothetical protein H5410_020863 [Solanum commersonii]|uniref:Uncharacterized protein n=1 Tax=Solanum commersonii TaxID=4109 RepID=A0A9J5ZFH7_SOLCO|nr:hypothetical protein H5410_020863 [Solanum commersonii]
MATAHKRYNTIDRLKVGDEEVVQCEWLQGPFIEAKVFKVANFCAVDKAHGPDGFTMGFYKECRKLLREI